MNDTNKINIMWPWFNGNGNEFYYIRIKIKEKQNGTIVSEHTRT